MARTREYWLQIENHPWDASPWGVDRITGRQLSQDRGGAYRRAEGEVLVVRPYSENWQQPADEPLNPWDLTEPDPARGPGVLPAAVLEAKVADQIIVHFRNRDQRRNATEAERTHSLHPHGVQRDVLYDGTYPLSPPDPAQGNKQGDRVAPGESFTYRWSCPQRAAAGTWLFHDHSKAGMASSALGAFGVLRILAPGEQPQDLPAGPLRRPGDTSTRFAALPEPPLRGDYLLVFHELPGVGLCINGRQGLGNTPTLVAGSRTRMTVRCLNATAHPVSLHMHGHRWEAGGRWMGEEVLAPHGGVTLSIRSSTAEHGGGPGEWLISGHAGGSAVQASLAVTEGGALTLAQG